METPSSFGEPELYLGLGIDKDLFDALQKIDPKIYSYYTHQLQYLVEMEFSQEKFLAKKIGNRIDYSDLILLESNLLSILKKLLPSYNFNSELFTLFAKN